MMSFIDRQLDGIKANKKWFLTLVLYGALFNLFSRDMLQPVIIALAIGFVVAVLTVFITGGLSDLYKRIKNE